MLVLTRRCGEKLVIAGDIIVTIVAIEGNKIRVGIDAPMSVRVDREEIHEGRIACEDTHEETPATFAAPRGRSRVPTRTMA